MPAVTSLVLFPAKLMSIALPVAVIISWIAADRCSAKAFRRGQRGRGVFLGVTAAVIASTVMVVFLRGLLLVPGNVLAGIVVLTWGFLALDNWHSLYRRLWPVQRPWRED